jgi:acyl-CoA reductase-like NAD-dependent aldehyde dehydrogenase
VFSQTTLAHGEEIVTTHPPAPAYKLAHPDRLFIGGRWIVPATSGRIDVISPAKEEVVATVAEAREADMNRVVQAARKAFDEGPWPRVTHVERAAYVQKLAELLKQRAPELSSAYTEQVGGLVTFAPMMVGGGVFTLEYFAGLASTYPFETRQPGSMGSGTAVIRREPVGVVVAIVPWNAPFGIMAQKIAPALVAGCTVIMKPSPETPVEAYIIAECAEAAGFPEGVINLVPAHRDASDFLVRQPGVDKISFTGSTIAGRRIASVCAERIARCTLELGGKSAAIVLGDFPIEEAAKKLTGTICIMSGQVCATLSRVIVPREKYKDFTEAFVQAMRAVRVGSPYDPQTQMGPLAMERQLRRVEGYISNGLAEGAKLATGGKRPKHLGRGFYFEPTLFTNVDNRMTIAQEEIFGPVICLIASENEDDAVRIANDSIYGLNGAVFTRDEQRAFEISKRVRTGCIGQNGLKLDFALPYGGFKQSGIGREGGPENFQAYLETKTVLLD